MTDTAHATTRPAGPTGGTWFVAPTPFTASGVVDEESIARIADAAVRWGCDGVTVLGVMGEVAALTDAERETVSRAVATALDSRIPFAVGCSGGSVSLVRSRVAAASDAGAAAAMVSAPPMAADVCGLPGFFAAVAGSSPLPLVIQDEPAATGVRVPVPVLVECLHASGSTVVKLEDPPTPAKTTRLLAVDPGLRVFGGLGGVAALQELGRGAVGTMTGFAFPEVLRSLRLAVSAGDDRRAGLLFDAYLPLIAFEAQQGVGLGIRKEILRRRGVLTCAATRTGPVPDARTLAELDDVLVRVGVLVGPDPLVLVDPLAAPDPVAVAGPAVRP